MIVMLPKAGAQAGRASRRASGGLAAVALLSGLVGCGAGSAETSDAPIDVAVAHYPLAYVTERIAGDRAGITNLTALGVEPHDLELGVSQIATLSDADLVVYQAGFQPAVDEAVERSDPAHVVDAAKAVDLDPTGGDPHFWMDPRKLSAVARQVFRALAEVDPAGRAVYADRYKALARDLDTLDRDYRTGLAECATSTVVVSHDAFSALATYGLDFAPVRGLSPEAEPSPAHLAALQELIASRGITTVFSEELASPELTTTLADDLGLETAVLDPVEGLSDRTQGEDYLSLMRNNLAALRKANQCS